MPTATGSFNVQLAPLELHHDGQHPHLGRRSIAKQFQGDLTGTSHGEMLSAMTGTQGSAGYVAIEHVTGSLNGREGSFTLQHSSTMTRGQPAQSVAVVPDSGTGALEGLTGRMTITNADGKHGYVLEYELPGD